MVPLLTILPVPLERLAVPVAPLKLIVPVALFVRSLAARGAGGTDRAASSHVNGRTVFQHGAGQDRVIAKSDRAACTVLDIGCRNSATVGDRDRGVVGESSGPGQVACRDIQRAGVGEITRLQQVAGNGK